ncbi:hypothetical protein GCM10007390_31110 [Persicitalea jodogahamensis]|uniref:Uncharacterized protein n=1 Tax=Persicitalea jodogahamensis TaxID=402147 RepID=A0A8J3D526_9BACT|nr:hypothetical protein GCM10007390_31110 [Persicitalea jodogahamensis]
MKLPPPIRTYTLAITGRGYPYYLHYTSPFQWKTILPTPPYTFYKQQGRPLVWFMNKPAKEVVK